MDACHIFPQCVLAVIPLTVGVIGVVLTRAWTGCWAGSALSSAVVTSLWRQGLLPSCWSRSPQIWFWAVAWGGCDWSTPAGRRATAYTSTGAVHWEVYSAASPVTRCVCSQSTMLLALPLAPPQSRECRQSARMSLRLCVHKATGTVRLQKLGTKTCCSCASGLSVGATESAQGPTPPPRTHKAHHC